MFLGQESTVKLNTVGIPKTLSKRSQKLPSLIQAKWNLDSNQNKPDILIFSLPIN